MEKDNKELNMRSRKHGYVAPLTEVHPSELVLMEWQTTVHVGRGFTGNDDISSGNDVGYGFWGEELNTGGGLNTGDGLWGEDLNYETKSNAKKRSLWDY